MTPLLVGATSLLAVMLLLGRSYHLLINATVTAGLLQAVATSITGQRGFQTVDDVLACALILAAAGSAVARNETRALLVIAAVVAGVGIALIRAEDLGVGVSQARQVLIPAGLVFAGFVLRCRVKWESVLKWVLLCACFVALWVVAEEILQRPLIDPIPYFRAVNPGGSIQLRQGLPPAYISDGVGGIIFRPGGPFMNPPTLGFFLATGAVSVVLLGRRRVVLAAYLVVLLLMGSALLMAYARAGLLIFMAATIAPYAWLRLGKPVAVVFAGGIAAYAGRQFLQEGNTASHTEGLLSGIVAGLRSVIGEGFGSSGFQAALAAGVANDGAGTESLLGLYATWLGIPAIVAMAAVLMRLWRTLSAKLGPPVAQTWAALGFFVAAGLSETASSVASTPVLWLLLGATLAGSAVAREQTRPAESPATLTALPTTRPANRRQTSLRRRG